MWSEIIGLRTKKSVLVFVLHAVVLLLVFVLQVWCCVVKHGLVTLVVIMNLKETATSQVGLDACHHRRSGEADRVSTV